MKYIILTLIIGFAFLIYRIVKDVYQSYQCVDERTLKDFMYGRLQRESDKYRQVVNHLGRCEECQEKLRDIQRGKPIEDHLVD